MSGSDCLIRPAQVMQCPICHTWAEFEEHLYERELPVLIRCSRCRYTYKLNHETKHLWRLPKRDPNLPVITKWQIDHTIPDFPEENPDTHSALMQEIAKLPPQLRMRGIKDRIDELGSMLLVARRVEHSIRVDFRMMLETFIQEVNSSVSPYVYLRGAIDGEALADFFEAPFMVLPLEYPDKNMQTYARLLLAPRFYRGLHGIPIGNGMGFTLQLVCPYAELDDPAPDFLRKMLAIPDYPKITVLDQKVVGGHVQFFWKDIAGTEADIDHSDNHASIRMKEDTSTFRQWAVQRGIKPWKDQGNRHDVFFQTRLDFVKHHWKQLHEPMLRLVEGGRLLYAHRDRATRLRMIGAAVQSLERWTIMIHAPGQQMEWKDLGVVAGTQVNQASFFPMDYTEYLRGDYSDRAELVIVEADQPWSEDIIRRLYRHTNRLLLLTGDPVFDTLEENVYAPMVYGLVNRVYYDRDSFLGPKVWRKESGRLSEKLITALRKADFLRSS